MIARAKPLLGTVVMIEADAPLPHQTVARAVDAAFSALAHIGEVMSAHDPHSDLGRMSRATSGQVLTVDAQTIAVLRAAQYWSRVSAGAFHPVKAAAKLSRQGVRPGLWQGSSPIASLEDVIIISDTQVMMQLPVSMDLGGIAKGYAVDQAIEVLAGHGIQHALVNAGGDIRAMGSKAYPIDVRHAGGHLRDRAIPWGRRLQQGAMATSVSQHNETDFVKTVVARHRPWRSATVMARDCMTADVLTKWVLQSSLLCPELKIVMRKHHATMWRS